MLVFIIALFVAAVAYMYYDYRKHVKVDYEDSQLDKQRYIAYVPALKLTIQSDEEIVFPLDLLEWNIQQSENTAYVVAQAVNQRIEMQIDYLSSSDAQIEFDLYELLTEKNLIIKNGFIYDNI